MSETIEAELRRVAARRPQDRVDARGLLLANPAIDLRVVRDRLALMRERGFDRDQDLEAKLGAILREVSDETAEA